MKQHRPGPRSPGPHVRFLSTGELLRPHTRCHRAKGLEGCVTTPLCLIRFLFGSGSSVSLDFGFVPTPLPFEFSDNYKYNF